MARTASPLPPSAASGRAPSTLRRYSESPQPPSVATAAAAAAATVSNTTGGIAATKTNNSATTTSSTATLSKRDKRLSVISEKVQGLTTAFADNRDQHYRAQVQACQIDMSLILLADPYANTPLADSSEEIAEMVGGAAVLPSAHQAQQYEGGKGASNGNGVMAGAGAGAVVGTGAHQAEQLAALVGRQYAQFAGDVNDAMEERDVALTMLNNKYENNLNELEQTHRYKILLAEEEHRLLASTIRERLVQVLSQKRSRLLRDKEQLDLADSNALLLHPNQFSINDPASPGGQQNNRKTRHTRHRIDPEELSSTAVAQENKRKRKAAFEETETGSPGPMIGGKSATTTATAAYNNNFTNNMTDAHAGSPYREARAKLVHTQFEAPLYSLDRLFTEKELSMVMNDAHIAATHFLTKLQTRDDDSKNKKTNDKKGDDITGIVAGDAAAAAAAAQEDGVESRANMDTASTVASGTLVATTTVDPADHDIPDMAPEMDRVANTSTMTTRGSTYSNNNNMNGNNQHLNSLLNPNGGPMAAAEAAAIFGNANANSIAAQSPSTSTLLLNQPNNATTIFPPTTIHHPIILPANIGSRANAAAPVPPALNPNDVDYDLALMARPGKTNEALNKQLLERACGPLITREYAYRAPGDVASGSGTGNGNGNGSVSGRGMNGGFGGVGADLGIGTGVAGIGTGTGIGSGAGMSDAATAAAVAGSEIGGVPMSVQSSLGGLSEGGGVGVGIGGGSVAMSRQSSARTLGASGLTNINMNKSMMVGGVGMRRTASANASTTGAGGARGKMKGH